MEAVGFPGLKNRATLINHADEAVKKRKFKPAGGGLLELPLPDSRLLALHAVCVRVAHMSGAAEVLDDFDRDVKETLVLSQDGASANLLDRLLLPYAPSVEVGA